MKNLFKQIIHVLFVGWFCYFFKVEKWSYTITHLSWYWEQTTNREIKRIVKSAFILNYPPDAPAIIISRRHPLYRDKTIFKIDTPRLKVKQIV